MVAERDKSVLQYWKSFLMFQREKECYYLELFELYERRAVG